MPISLISKDDWQAAEEGRLDSTELSNRIIIKINDSLCQIPTDKRDIPLHAELKIDLKSQDLASTLDAIVGELENSDWFWMIELEETWNGCLESQPYFGFLLHLSTDPLNVKPELHEEEPGGGGYYALKDPNTWREEY
jgi:hypothetical protein